MSEQTKTRILSKADAAALKKALDVLPSAITVDPARALKIAQTIVGEAMNVNPTRLAQLGIGTEDAAQLAHAGMTPIEVLRVFGVGKADDANKPQAEANLAELTDRAPVANLRAAKQTKLNAKKAPAPSPVDPKVTERKGVLEVRNREFARVAVEDNGKGRRVATETEVKALDAAEKKWTAAGAQWSGNGYRVGTSGTDP